MIRTDDNARREWRTFGFWVLAHGLWAWPLMIFLIALVGLAIEESGVGTVVTQLVAAYGVHVAGFMGAAGIRQWGKNNARAHGGEE